MSAAPDLVTFAGTPGGRVRLSTGGAISRSAAFQLQAAYRALFRGGVPVRPWPPFLGPPAEIRAELASLNAALGEP
jgi:hypothetical protein